MASRPCPVPTDIYFHISKYHPFLISHIICWPPSAEDTGSAAATTHKHMLPSQHDPITEAHSGSTSTCPTYMLLTAKPNLLFSFPFAVMNSWPKQLKEGRKERKKEESRRKKGREERDKEGWKPGRQALFWLSVQGYSLSWQQIQEAPGDIGSTVRKQRSESAQLPFSMSEVQDPSPGNGVTHTYSRSSHLNEPNLDNPSWHIQKLTWITFHRCAWRLRFWVIIDPV